LISFSLDIVKDQLNHPTSTINFLITLFQVFTGCKNDL